MEPEEPQAIDIGALNQPVDPLENEPMPIISKVRPRMTEAAANQQQPPEYGRTIVIKGPGTGKFGAPLHVPTHAEQISTARLIDEVRDCLQWLTPEDIDPLRDQFELLYDEALSNLRTSRVHRVVLLRLRHLAHRLNQLITESEEILDVIERGGLTYADLRQNTISASFATTRFEELQQELRLIENLEDAISSIEETNTWVTENVPHRAFSIPTHNLVPRFHSIEALHKSLLSLLEVCKAFAYKVLHEISEISGRIQHADFISQQQIMQMIGQLENELAYFIQQIQQIDQWALTPLIRPDKLRLLQNLSNLMNIIPRICRIRRLALYANVQYEETVDNQVPLRPTAARSRELQERWNEYLEWSHNAQQMLQDLNVRRQTEYDIRTRPLERMPAEQIQQQQQQLEHLQEMQDIEDIIANDLEEMQLAQEIRELEEMMAKDQEGQQEQEDAEELITQTLEEMQAGELEKLLDQQLAEEQQQPDVTEQEQADDAVAGPSQAPGIRSIWDYVLESLNTVSEPESSQPNWRTIPGGAAGHSRGSATVSRPPDDDDDEESPSPKRLKRDHTE